MQNINHPQGGNQTAKHRILDLLIKARRGEYFEWAIPGQLRIESGWLPLFTFQSPFIGGSAANMRLWELKAPQGSGPEGVGCGIPVEKKILKFDHEGKSRLLHLYRLNLKPQNIDRFIDFDKLCIRPEALASARAKIVEHDESVKIVPIESEPELA